MLVDNSQPTHFGADFADFINTDLFAPANSSSSASPPSDNDSSPPQSPFHSLLTTPPQDLPPAAFPDFGISSLASASPNGSGLAFLDDESFKDPAAYDFMSLPGMNSIAMNYPGVHMPMDLSMGFNMDSVMSIDNASSSDLASYFGIDPALVGTPAPSARATELETVEEEDESSQDAQLATQKPTTKPDEQRERLTLTITPSKVGGHGKSRKGTVQSGGIVKKSASPPSAHSSRDKENSSLLSTTSGQSAVTIAANAAALKRAKSRASSEVSSIGDADEFFSSNSADKSSNKDDLAIDWRPSPEVLAKMSSKEKRQLRNKISARNFRVRRKEYITTLEGDIAERDRLLDAVRSELGSTQSENLALREEIAALKKILLEGRGTESLASLKLPPPAPLAVSTLGSVSGYLPSSGASSGSVSGSLGDSSSSAFSPVSTGASGVIDPTLTPHSSATNANVSLPTPSSSPQPSTSSLGLLTPNTQKDLPTSPRLGAGAFWGGTTRSSLMGMGGGITPVHTVLIPDLSHALGAGGLNESVSRGEKSVTRALQENMNPALNGTVANKNVNISTFGTASGGFEGWTDSNPLTMKTLDAYRMHLWGKMAAQQHLQRSQNAQNHRQPPTTSLTGLASNLRPHYFSSYPSPPSIPGPSHSTLSALLSGKHSTLGSSSYSSYSGLPTPPGSPNLTLKGTSDRDVERFREKERDREQREQSAALAVLAGQTLFKKLGGAFWDAFSGHTTPSTSSSPSSSSVTGTKNWDVDKVRKVLEGKAVVRVVDVEPLASSSSSSSISSLMAGMASMSVGSHTHEESKKAAERKCVCTEILEESMRTLTVSKKA